MKKFKLIAIALLASTFGLTSCDIPEFLQGPADWARQNIPGAANLIDGGSKEEGGKEEHHDEDVEPAEVLSVKINSSVSIVTDETDPFKLPVKVETKGDASKEVTWSSSDPSVATVDANGLVTPIAAGQVTITATSVADGSKSDSISIEVAAVPGILSVAVQSEVTEALLHGAPIQLTAVVAAKGTAAKGVTWKSSDESVALVDENGLVSFLSAGQVTITATSKFDPKKSGSIDLTCVNKGLRPELLEQGYEYSEEFPYAAAKSFAGEDVFGFEAAEGFYFKEYEPTEESIGAFEILAELTEDNAEAASAIFFSDYGYYYDSSYEVDCFIDPTISFEMDLQVVEMDEEGSDYMLGAFIYHIEDIFTHSFELTEDTEWEPETAETLAAYGIELPFIALGADYDVYVYSNGMIEISDHAPFFHRLDNYGDLLVKNGYELIESEEGSYYYKDIDAYSYAVVAFEFNEYGNSIQAMVGLTELDAFPAEELGSFVELFSKYEVPAFELEGAKFTFEVTEIEMDSDGEDVRDCVVVGLHNASNDDIFAYADKLIADGFDIDLEASFFYSSGYSYIVLTKGKIVALVVVEYASREATDAEIDAFIDELIDLDNRYDELNEEELARYDELYMSYLYYYFGYGWTVYEYDQVEAGELIVTYDLKGMEDPGVYIYEDELTLAVGSSYELDVVLFELEEGTEVTFSSLDEKVATVDENGVISVVGAGLTYIFAEVEGTEYFDYIKVSGYIAKTFADALAEINDLMAADGVYAQLNLPELEGFEYINVLKTSGDYYRIVCYTTETEDDYTAKLGEEPYNFELGVDSFGYPIATNANFRIEPWQSSSGNFYIDVYVLDPGDAQPEPFANSVTFSELGYENGDEVTSIALESGALIEFGMGENENNGPKYYNTGAGVRTYQKNTITVTAPEGGELTSVSFEMSQHNKAMTADCGNWDEETLTWTATEEGTQSVTFTVEDGSGHNRISGMTVNGLALPSGPVIVPAEFPQEGVNAITAELGANDTLPAFTGVATGYNLVNSQIQVSVPANTEADALAQYQKDLKEAGFTEIGPDQYGDMHFASPNGELDVVIWNGNDIGNAGVIYIDVKAYSDPITEFPLEYVNAFLADNGFGFQLTEDMADAINAMLPEGSSFILEEGLLYGSYPWLNVAIEGEHASELEALLKETIEAAGFEYDDYYESYYNDADSCVSFSESGGYTSLYFCY